MISLRDSSLHYEISAAIDILEYGYGTPPIMHLITHQWVQGGVKWGAWLLNRTDSSSGETSPLAALGCSTLPSLRPKTAPVPQSTSNAVRMIAGLKALQACSRCLLNAYRLLASL